MQVKWHKKTHQKLPKTFTETYHAETRVIDKENFREFVKIEEKDTALRNKNSNIQH
jgi:hypothetical protein